MVKEYGKRLQDLFGKLRQCGESGREPVQEIPARQALRDQDGQAVRIPRHSHCQIYEIENGKAVFKGGIRTAKKLQSPHCIMRVFPVLPGNGHIAGIVKLTKERRKK